MFGPMLIFLNPLTYSDLIQPSPITYIGAELTVYLSGLQEWVLDEMIKYHFPAARHMKIVPGPCGNLDNRFAALADTNVG